MAIRFTDQEIASLLGERKALPDDWRDRIRMSAKRGHKERQIDIDGAGGGEFRIILRQNVVNALDFSVILATLVPQSNQLFRLRRYNGRSHQHTNQIEGNTFYGFHIHTATERYQEVGTREDAYAELTDSYATFDEALRRLFSDANFVVPLEPQSDLFEGN